MLQAQPRGSTTSPTTTTTHFPWKQSPSLTAHRIVALCAMIHWSYLGFRHIWSFDYYDHQEQTEELAATTAATAAATIFIPAGFQLAQIVMGALLCWDIPSSIVGGSGPTDLMMHIHHLGMVLVTSCVLFGNVGTHVAPIFLGVIELSSIPLQIVDLFHPKKSPHWNEYVNTTMSSSSSSSALFFQKVCSTVNEISRILFAILFLLVRGMYFPYIVVKIAIPDFYAEGSLSSTILLIMSILFSLLQMYWATLVIGQIMKATTPASSSSLSSSSGSGRKEKDDKPAKCE